jgi:hypothetical protein
MFKPCGTLADYRAERLRRAKLWGWAASRALARAEHLELTELSLCDPGDDRCFALLARIHRLQRAGHAALMRSSSLLCG